MTHFFHSVCGARWALVLGACLACAGCGGDEEAGGQGGTGGVAGATSGPTALSFDPNETLTLVPGEVRSVAVVATPPGQYLVRFALLGDAKDAALDKSEAATDASGRVEVAVTAPSSARTFSLRASAGEKVSTSLGVSVSDSGFASLQVSPDYGGKRTVSHWVASVRTGVTCAELSGELLTDGDLKGKAPFGKVPQIDDVPVGPGLAVTLRGAESIAGCKELGDLRAGEIEAVKVPVFDLPMRLDDTELELELGLDPVGSGKWPELLGVDAVLAAFSPTNNDAAALLDAMHASTADVSAAAAFQSARKSGGWDALVQTAIGGPSALRQQLKPWLTQGAESFSSPNTFRGRLSGADGASGKAWLELSTVGGTDAKTGFPTTYLAAWNASPDDSVALGVDLVLLPSRLLAALALAPAKASVSGAGSTPDALAELASCDAVAKTLVAAGALPGEAFAKCDVKCATSLCEAGLVKLWAAAADASADPGAPAATLSVAATASASVDDFARPNAFDGTWVGNFAAGSASTTVSGPASAKQPAPPE